MTEAAEVHALVERAKAGEREAFEELYLLHFDRIYGYLQMRVGNKHDAEDLTNQTFVKMIESIERFEWRNIWGAYVAAYGFNNVVPARGGDIMKLFLIHGSISGSTYPAVGSSFFVAMLSSPV